MFDQAPGRRADRSKASASITVVLDADGRIDAIDAAGAALIGCDAAGLIGQPWIDRFIPEADRARVTAIFQAIIGDTGDSVRCRSVHNDLLTADGRRIPIRWHNSRLELPGGGSKTVSVGTSPAVSDTEMFLDAVIESLVEGLVLTDHQGIIRRINRSAAVTFGWPAGSLIGQNVKILMTEADSTHHAGYMENHVATGTGTAHGRSRDLVGRRRDGTEFPIRVALSEVKTSHDHGFVAVVQDITEQKRSETLTEQLAYFCRLTGLPNRQRIRDMLEDRLGRSRRQGDRFAVLQIDLDRFKRINDLFGYETGDEVLVRIAERIRDRLDPETDVLGRLSGDEFIILAGDTGDGHRPVTMLANELLSALREPVTVGDYEIHVSCSIGVVPDAAGIESVNALMQALESATYRAKETGRNRLSIYSDQVLEATRQRHVLEERLRRAVSTFEGFTLHYQPKVDLSTRTIVGAEALVRWQDKQLGSVSPGRFVPVAEDTGLIVPIGDWVLAEACRQAQRWRDAGWTDFQVAVNVAPQQLRGTKLLDRIAALLDESGLPPANLQIEITEGGLIDDADAVIETLEALKTFGLTVAIDDFGTGYSSLSYLKRFPLDYLKIDQSFVRGLPWDQGDRALCDSVIGIARSLWLGIIAEGVETEEQYSFLLDRGCNLCQGYLISKPVPADDFSALLQAQAPG